MRAWLREALRVRDTPEAQARGLAVGVFFGVSPLFGLQLVLAVAAAHLVRGNRVLAGAATAVSNPLTSLPLYGACLLVGQALLPGPGPALDLASLAGLGDLLALGPRFAAQLLLGTTVVGVVGAAATYLLAARALAFAERWAGERPREVVGSPS